MPADPRLILDHIRTLAQETGPLRIMNVCGGHERTISLSGLRSLLPAGLELIPGPGCPVCVCPEEDVHQAMQLALREEAIVVAFGDMLRVPVNLPRREPRSLAETRAAGADIRAIASPAEAVAIARTHPDRPVVFFAAGFETTIAPVAAMLAEGVPDNLFVLLAGRLTWPAVAMLLDFAQPGFEALIAPGHVAAVTGADEWRFVAAGHGLPVAVAGFTPDSLLAAIASVLRQRLNGVARLDNCYAEVVSAGGNPRARQLLDDTLDIVDAAWRGIGIIPRSGFALKPALAAHDARRAFPDYDDDSRRRRGDMPPGCDCARVVLGRIAPHECVLYGRACTPRTPIGPCMVSDEGACHIWWSSGRRAAVAAPA
jgi:hydrogenase expression/formation protein HypD